MTNDKQRERLVELLNDAEYNNLDYEMANKFYPFDDYKSHSKFVADYLLANGVIVPPVSIGQTVYAIDRRSQLWWKGTAMSLCYTGTGMEFGVLFDDGEFAVYKDDAVFLTKEEAEKALGGVQG